MNPRPENFEYISEVVDTKLAALFEEAERSPRGRAHLLLHRDHSDQVQRLLIATCEDTYFRPQQHPEQWELLTLLRGDATVIIFGSDGRIIRRCPMLHAPVIQILPRCWHTLVVTAPQTLLLEIKPGPFRKTEFASWAPEEGGAAAQHYLRQLLQQSPE